MPATYGFLSTYPPTQCGLATFNAALGTHLNAGSGRSGVVRLLAGDDKGGLTVDRSAPRVVHTWPTDRPDGWVAAANALNRFDVVIVQHEYGIYPGDAGQEVLPLLRAVKAPTIVVLHTVLSTPDPLQRSVLERVVAAADAVVTMTDTARQRLTDHYHVDPSKISVIPHGAAGHCGAPRDRNARPHLLTWGLLGPGKGIEWALRAVALLGDLDPAPVYTIAGRTHPKVLEQQGDRYRESLRELAADLGVTDRVRWEDSYMEQSELNRLIRSADLVVLPYDSTEQVTSGVLIEAVGAGVPVVATEFPHAVELLSDGPGMLVPHQAPEVMAAGIRRMLDDRDTTGRLSRITAGPTLRWPAVAARYQALAQRLLGAREHTARRAGTRVSA
ncbi:glycosyltransferase [Mangrovihabitans endophyticus]|uniref:Glycosyl transferase family 1 n=1 Tax=Mangrovihabitans endophyticus TaxID=1751298 RepID=A0A8J3BYM1_9ACTN|nr:glycosyltransferase [Mangrovihabitans endophyticus]GGK80996.1 glycosyl transferase family 1 [Mangrovihabitans endophyticus]